MANTDQNITELPIKTSSEVLDADYMLGIDLVEGYQVTTKDFADYAVNRAAISIGGKTQTTASAISEVRTTAGNAQPKESGKGLSANDFTNAYKSKLDGIAAGAEVNVQSDWNASSGDAAILHKPTTISGYGITDAYTKAQVDTSLAAKSDKATTYTKSDVDAIVNTDDDTSEAANPLVIETDAAQYAKNTHLTLEPVQDLHGYDHPWPAGGGKNLFDEQYPNIDGSMRRIYVQTGDGTFTLSTTALIVEGSANLFLQTGQATSGESTASNGVYSGTPRTVTATDGYVTISYRIVNNTTDAGNPLKCKAQLEVGSTATSYEPYSNICPITPMGHRNLLPMTVDGIKAANGGASTWLDNTKTINGVTFTIMADDESRVVGIKANGTASANTFCNLLTADFVDASVNTWATPTAGGYTISSGNTGDSSSTYGVGIDVANHLAYCLVRSGYTANNLIFKPMLRPASDPDSTFVSYGVTRVGAKATGKNLLNRKSSYTNTANSITFIADGLHMRATGTASGSNTDTARYEFSPVTLLKDNTYTFSLNGVESGPATANMRLFINATSIMWLGTASLTDGMYVFTITPTEDILFNGIAIRFYTSSGTVMNIDGYLQLELGSTATAYEPYTESVSSLDLPEEVYGGTLNLETGELVVDRVSVDLGTLTWRLASDIQAFYTSVADGKRDNSATGNGKAICSAYNVVVKTYANMVNGDMLFGNWIAGGTVAGIVAKDSNYSEAASFKAAMSGVQLAYELATPITYQLTPQQLALFRGINNISTNAKTVQVTYRDGELATTGNIVDAVEVAKQNAIGESASYTDAKLATELAPILGDLATAEISPASASHAVGEYLLYNKHLYKVLAAISAGQQLTIGTNVGQTNVAAELASLNARYIKKIILANGQEELLVPNYQIWILIINWGNYSNMYNIENYANGIYIKNMIVNSNITSITISTISGGYRITNNQDSQCTAVAFRIA